jgi:putative Holliday junction resolvase
MSIRNPEELKAALAPGARLLGVDYGAKAIGIAISDERLSVASPLTTLKRGRFADLLKELQALIARHNVGGVVVGLPLNMDGSTGPSAQAARTFARNLLQHVTLPLAFWDERMSTMAVERAMIDADLSRAKRDARIDAAAAAYILQGCLDRLRGGSER